MREIKEHQIRLTGTASIPHGLTNGKSYTIAMELVCNGIDISDNEDGTDTYRYKCRPFGNIVITNREGKKIHTTIKGRKSVNMRMALMRLYDSKQRDIDFDTFYNQEMDRLISEINLKNT